MPTGRLRGIAPVLLLTLASASCSVPFARPGETLLTREQLAARQGVSAGVAPAPRSEAESPTAGQGPAPATETRRAASPVRAAYREPVKVTQGRWIRVAEGQSVPVLPFSLHREPIADVMTALAEETGTNIVLDDDPAVRGKILTAEVRNLPWHLGLEAVLEAHGLRPIHLPSGVIKIVSRQTAEADRIMTPVELRFMTAADMNKALAALLSAHGDSTTAAVEFVGDPQTSRRLVVKGSAEEIAQIRGLIARLDRRPPTVTIEMNVVQLNRSQMRKIGVNYAFGRIRDDSTGSFVPAMDVRKVPPKGGISSENGPALKLFRDLGGLGTVNLNVFVDAVVGHGFAETQTTPMISTTSETPAYIRVGDQIVLPNNQPIFAGGVLVPGQPGQGGVAGQGQQPGGYPGGYGDHAGGLQPVGGITPNYGATVGGFTRFQTGTTLEVTPYVLGDGLVRVKISLERDGGTLDPSGRTIQGGHQALVNDAIVQDGVPIVIGGLTVNARSDGTSGVPLLSRLPIVGSAFRTDESAEQYQDLIIILTPRIHEDSLHGTAY